MTSGILQSSVIRSPAIFSQTEVFLYMITLCAHVDSYKPTLLPSPESVLILLLLEVEENQVAPCI